MDVKGKIVLARYGGLFRGLKVYNAQKRGRDRRPDLFRPRRRRLLRGDVYPHGPFRPPSAIQRGSVQFLSLGPGDPSTPNGPSVKGAERLPFDPLNGFPARRAASVGRVRSIALRCRSPNWEKKTGLDRDDYFATIPSLPISYEAAQPILEAPGRPTTSPTAGRGACRSRITSGRGRSRSTSRSR